LPTIVHIVDDEPSVRNAIGRLLRLAGYDVATYESAEQLFHQLPENQESGCILLDMLMPDVNGLELQERLKKVGSTLPIVFMTGGGERRERGTRDFLKKPVSKEKLLDAIERTLWAVRTAE
jgi:FixJ family two-component response regulator